MQKRHEALLMRVGDGNVEVGRQLALLDLNVCWSPLLGGEGGVRTEYWERGTNERWKRGRRIERAGKCGRSGDGVCGVEL